MKNKEIRKWMCSTYLRKTWSPLQNTDRQWRKLESWSRGLLQQGHLSAEFNPFSWWKPQAGWNLQLSNYLFHAYRQSAMVFGSSLGRPWTYISLFIYLFNFKHFSMENIEENFCTSARKWRIRSNEELYKVYKATNIKIITIKISMKIKMNWSQSEWRIINWPEGLWNII